MDYAEPYLPFEFPAAMLDRLAGLRTIGVLADPDELVITAMIRHGVTTRADYRALRWIFGSRFWPPGWDYDVQADGDLNGPGALV